MLKIRYRNFRRRRWLWWLVGMIFMIGLLVTCGIRSQPHDSDVVLLRVWLACLFLIGVCVVCATSERWLK